MFARLAARLLLPLIRFDVRPADAAAQFGGATNVCYVLERELAADRLVLQRACTRARLPRPNRRLPRGADGRDWRACLALTRTVGLLRHRVDRRPPEALRSLLEQLRADPAFDVQFVPTAVYWGRAPRREGSVFKLAFTEDWALASRVRRVFRLLFNGRNALVQFGAPVSLRSLVGGEAGGGATRQLARALQAQLSAARAAHIGPDLSHRRTLRTQVLRTRAVRAAVAQEAREKKIPRRKALQNAATIFDEIAANYSHAFVTIADRVFTWLWTRIYDGVEFAHSNTLHEIAAGNEIIYVPCHRSTMDDVLLPYVIYKAGFAVPHIAAGINLNLPVVGRLMRMGGAFFMRRSFRGNALYTVVFMKYLATIMARGHSITYFVEGGRSRTGRLLGAKTGMLSMTIRSYLREPVRPVVFQPVYFAYERIMEGESYVGELSGKPKEAESFLGLLRGLRKLRERFGRVHVNLGEPIHLTQVLDAAEPGWRSKPPEEQARAHLVNAAVDKTAGAIMRNINAAAAVTPVNVLALVLLATPRQLLPEDDLLAQVDLYLRLLRQLPYSPRMTVTPLGAAEVLAYGHTLGILARQDDAGGGPPLIGFAPGQAALMAYYRNNVLHLVAMPSLLACCFLGNAVMETADLQRLGRRIYPYITAELFLRWREEELEPVVAEALEAFAALGLLAREEGGTRWRRPPPDSAAAVQLSLLAQPMVRTVERYYLVIALLLKAGSGVLSSAELELRCRTMVQRMDALYGLSVPEFFDRSLHDGFVGLLRRRGVLRTVADGKLAFDEVLERVAEDAQLVLSETLRHSVLQVVHG
jgi:glycerol-3-phosphate O-acyltransferase